MIVCLLRWISSAVAMTAQLVERWASNRKVGDSRFDFRTANASLCPSERNSYFPLRPSSLPVGVAQPDKSLATRAQKMYFALVQGLREGGRWGQWPWGPWSLGAHGLQGAHQRVQWLHRVHRNNSDKSVFFEVTSKSGENFAIFILCFGPHKTKDAWCLSWPRAHIWVSAPLR